MSELNINDETIKSANQALMEKKEIDVSTLSRTAQYFIKVFSSMSAEQINEAYRKSTPNK
ncbi:TPA: hypothetical protein QDB06_000811 [Burkholderia vietnamiensis]|nr:hypothetical protein [Burkholderia vietnamiensis]